MISYITTYMSGKLTVETLQSYSFRSQMLEQSQNFSRYNTDMKSVPD
jgi:hypothetical protein